jgi:hypothetical protein
MARSEIMEIWHGLQLKTPKFVDKKRSRVQTIFGASGLKQVDLLIKYAANRKLKPEPYAKKLEHVRGMFQKKNITIKQSGGGGEDENEVVKAVQSLLPNIEVLKCKKEAGDARDRAYIIISKESYNSEALRADLMVNICKKASAEYTVDNNIYEIILSDSFSYILFVNDAELKKPVLQFDAPLVTYKKIVEGTTFTDKVMDEYMDLTLADKDKSLAEGSFQKIVYGVLKKFQSTHKPENEIIAPKKTGFFNNGFFNNNKQELPKKFKSTSEPLYAIPFLRSSLLDIPFSLDLARNSSFPLYFSEGFRSMIKSLAQPAAIKFKGDLFKSALNDPLIYEKNNESFVFSIYPGKYPENYYYEARKILPEKSKIKQTQYKNKLIDKYSYNGQTIYVIFTNSFPLDLNPNEPKDKYLKMACKTSIKYQADEYGDAYIPNTNRNLGKCEINDEEPIET